MLHFVPVIACQGNPMLQNPCLRRTQLPYPIHPETTERPPDQPNADWILNFVCPSCGHRADYDRTHIQWRLVPEGVREVDLPGTLLWRIEFECARESCGLPLVTHTKGSREATDFDLLRIVDGAYPPLSCAEGHRLSFPPILKSAEALSKAW